MKKSLFLTLLILTNSVAMGQGFLWTDQISSESQPVLNRVAVDSVGNIYVTGGFAGNASFGGSNLTSIGSIDIFLAKYNSNGDFVWVQQVGSAGSQDAARGICVDTNGNVYIIGSFQQTAVFGAFSLTAIGQTDTSGRLVDNLFFAEYAPDGTVLAAQQQNGVGQSGGVGLDIAVDNLGNIYTTGYYYDSGLQPAVTIAKWTAQSLLVWDEQLNETSGYFFPMAGTCLTLDAAGNVYFGGVFGHDVTVANLPGTFTVGMFLSKVDGNGNFLWAVQPANQNGSENDVPNSLGMDSIGNLVTAGNFNYQITFGSNTLSTGQGVSGFIARCDTNGNFKNSWQIPTLSSTVNAAFLDSFDNIYATGGLTGSSGASEMYLNKYKSDGSLLWSITPIISTHYSTAQFGAIDRSNRVDLLSTSSGEIAFDNLTFTNIGGNDLFLSQVSETVPPVFVIQPASPVGLLEGSSFALTAEARSISPVQYQWQFQGQNIAGATNFSLLVTNAQPSAEGVYQLIASNIYGVSTSSPANVALYFTVSVIPNGSGSVSVSPPGFTLTNGLVCFVDQSLVTLTAKSNSPNTFLNWSGTFVATNDPLNIVVGSNIVLLANFADSSTNLIIDNMDPRASFTGAWSLSDSFHQYDINCAVTASSTNTTATADFVPDITAPGYYDVSIWIPRGYYAPHVPWEVFGASEDVTNYINEQLNGGFWQLVAPAVYFAAGTNGFARVSNGTGQTGSAQVVADAVRFYPSPPTTVSISTPSLSVSAGTDVSLQAIPIGVPPFSYQWTFDGTNLPGATSSVLNLNDVLLSNRGVYSVIVSNIINVATSSPAALQVNPPVPPVFSSISLGASNQVQISVASDPGITVSLQVSSNLVSWETITNAMTTASGVLFIDNAAAQNAAGGRFYRVVWIAQ